MSSRRWHCRLRDQTTTTPDLPAKDVDSKAGRSVNVSPTELVALIHQQPAASLERSCGQQVMHPFT